MLHIQISESLQSYQLPQAAMTELLDRAAQAVLERQATHPQEDASLVLTDDAQVQELNSQYLGIDAPTDVLSFPAGDDDPDSGAYYLGDVLISYPRAASQALAGGHAVEAELQLLAVHGMLHLYGYDHLDQESKATMWAIQAALLRQLDCPISGPALEAEI
jgi:probable rRNA maturation factor